MIFSFLTLCGCLYLRGCSLHWGSFCRGSQGGTRTLDVGIWWSLIIFLRLVFHHCCPVSFLTSCRPEPPVDLLPLWFSGLGGDGVCRTDRQMEETLEIHLALKSSEQSLNSPSRLEKTQHAQVLSIKKCSVLSALWARELNCGKKTQPATWRRSSGWWI